jgi:hypothetical protein
MKVMWSIAVYHFDGLAQSGGVAIPGALFQRRAILYARILGMMCWALAKRP